ncbi:hypothetical protein GP486_006766 [Trichoglossum hirsutum]|uniref:Haloacid dehalogenase-like hydrolase n=1 Tax=Trichoglossum hirsutum TaxID=265104 RepID=A0A9P8I7J0_9PEZI|nr:hypothetical protein GP486_006766 [Trichoglossum hirsutum]
MSSRCRSRLLLTLDAFGTIFTPREPVLRQYLDVARGLGFTPVDESLLQDSFRNSFKEQSRLNPNYGRDSGMKSYEWWANIIKSTFSPFISKANPLPVQLVPELLARFSSSEGYRLYPDVLPFFQTVRQSRRLSAIGKEGSWPWDLTMIGVVTNSDDRVPSILSSLGLTVGDRRAGMAEQVFRDGAQFQAARGGHTINVTPASLPTWRHSDQLDKDIHFVVLSYDVGAEKPDPQIFRAAKDMLEFTLRGGNGGQPGTIPGRKEEWPVTSESANTGDFTFLHIGDDVEKDVIGAQKAGFHSVLLDREGKYSRAFERSENKILSVPLGEGGSSASHEMQVIQDLRDLPYWASRLRN